MTDFLRSILQTAHNANAATAAASMKTEVQPVDQIQVPPSACAADATASLLALEKQPCMIKVEISEPASASATTAATNIPLTADSSKAQRAARRDVVNARRETKRKSMSSSSDSDDCAAYSEPLETTSPVTATIAAPAALDKSKKMKTGKTTSALVTSALDMDARATKKSAQSPASSPLSSSSCSSSMLFGAEIDALGEERLRAMEAQLESLDPDSKEAKKKRRLIRNRMSAQLHRERKKAYVGQLEDQLLEKERELKALQDKLAAMANETQQMKQQLAQTAAAAAAPVATAPAPVVAAPVASVLTATPAATVAAASPTPMATVVEIEDDVVIKAEPIVDVASAFDATATPTAASSKDNWDYCFPSLDDAEMADVAADDLLRDFDHPFATYAAAIAHEQKEAAAAMAAPHHEIHAAKKNIVMVMGMMFSATFFGNSPFFFDVQSGSTFSSYFQANPPKELSQLNVASKIMSSLEKSSWKDFRDIASWTTAATADVADDVDNIDGDKANEADSGALRAAASPSAASDITDSSDTCDSPAQLDDECLGGLTGLETDLIDEFVYPVDDPFAPALADTNWFGDDADDFGQSDVDDNDDDVVMVPRTNASTSAPLLQKSESVTTSASQSITSRLFEKLTALWHEKNQVLLTVLDGKNEVTRRSVADMSAIRKSMENGNIFAAAGGASVSGSAAAKTSPLANDESVSFLYPLSAFSPAEETTDPDVMFLEVSCQMSALSI